MSNGVQVSRTIVVLLVGALSGACASKAPIEGSPAAALVPFRDVAGRFTLSYPARGWKVTDQPAGPEVARLVHSSNDATVTLTLEATPVALLPGWGEIYRKNEEERIRREKPGAEQVSAVLADGPLGDRQVVITYTLPGGAQVTERTMPVPGKAEVYRFVAVLRGARGEAQRGAVDDIARSLKLGAGQPR